MEYMIYPDFNWVMIKVMAIFLQRCLENVDGGDVT
jgi:hypothetical protein